MVTNGDYQRMPDRANGGVLPQRGKVMELHQMSVQKLTEKLEKAEKELAVAVIENADLRERLSSLENLYRVRDKDCADKNAERDELREALVAIKARIKGEFDHPALLKLGALGEIRNDVERIIDSALASPADGITGTEQCVNGGTCGAGGFCDECEISPVSQQLDIEDQIGGGGGVTHDRLQTDSI